MFIASACQIWGDFVIPRSRVPANLGTQRHSSVPLLIFQNDTIIAIDLKATWTINGFRYGCSKFFADIVRAVRQFAMATVDRLPAEYSGGDHIKMASMDCTDVAVKAHIARIRFLVANGKWQIRPHDNRVFGTEDSVIAV
jgi:hypothetical protein